MCFLRQSGRFTRPALGERPDAVEKCRPMDERLRFVARLLEGEKMAPLCREFGTSRVTGYKIDERYKTCGLGVAGEIVGIREVDDQIWLVSFLDFDLGFFDRDENRVEPALNPLRPETGFESLSARQEFRVHSGHMVYRSFRRHG